jgi:hypothetical protein
VVYVTRGLLEALLELAADAEPERFTVALETTSAEEFETDLGLPAGTPVFTHLYHPDAGQSVSAVFGMDFSTPMGRTHGRFVSHPGGDLSVSLTDDLHATMLVAVPPWERESVAAFDRRGRKRSLEVVDAEPPVETL